LAQSWKDKEVVVVDDGSTDGSLEIIRSFGERIQWETGPNRGGGAARNRLLELACGQWLQYLDADDWLMPEHLSREMSVFQADAASDVVFSPVTMEHWSHDLPGMSGDVSAPRREILPIHEHDDPWLLLIRWRLPQTGASLFRRSAVVEVDGWKINQP